MTNDGTPKPVGSYDPAFQTRLREALLKKKYLQASVDPTLYEAITEVVRETIQACKPQEWDYTDTDAVAALDEYETALLEALDPR